MARLGETKREDEGRYREASFSNAFSVCSAEKAGRLKARGWDIVMLLHGKQLHEALWIER